MPKGAACYPHPARTSSPPSQDENRDAAEEIEAIVMLPEMVED
jgi:hypothetical protein